MVGFDRDTAGLDGGQVLSKDVSVAVVWSGVAGDAVVDQDEPGVAGLGLGDPAGNLVGAGCVEDVLDSQTVGVEVVFRVVAFVHGAVRLVQAGNGIIDGSIVVAIRCGKVWYRLTYDAF